MFSRKIKAIFAAWSKIAFLIGGVVFVSCATTGGLGLMVDGKQLKT